MNRSADVAVLAVAIVATLAGDAQAQEAEGRFGGGVAIGLNPSPGDACRADGDSISCVTFLPAWALRGQVTAGVLPRLAASLVVGAGSDLDQSGTVSSDGAYGTHGRQLFDLAARLRQDLGGRGRFWITAEAGLALARDWSRDHAPGGKLSSSDAATQVAPLVGLLAGLVPLRHGPLAADLEAGVRLTMFGHHPPALAAIGPGAARGATEYGTRAWLWLGIGLRLGR